MLPAVAMTFRLPPTNIPVDCLMVPPAFSVRSLVPLMPFAATIPALVSALILPTLKPVLFLKETLILPLLLPTAKLPDTAWLAFDKLKLLGILVFDLSIPRWAAVITPLVVSTTLLTAARRTVPVPALIAWLIVIPLPASVLFENSEMSWLLVVTPATALNKLPSAVTAPTVRPDVVMSLAVPVVAFRAAFWMRLLVPVSAIEVALTPRNGALMTAVVAWDTAPADCIRTVPVNSASKSAFMTNEPPVLRVTLPLAVLTAPPNIRSPPLTMMTLPPPEVMVPAAAVMTSPNWPPAVAMVAGVPVEPAYRPTFKALPAALVIAALTLMAPLAIRFSVPAPVAVMALLTVIAPVPPGAVPVLLVCTLTTAPPVKAVRIAAALTKALPGLPLS